MNESLQSFARQSLKDGLAQCSEDAQMLFKRMYSYKDLTKDINQVVDEMPEDKLDWAMQQVQRTLNKAKNEEKKENPS